MWFYTRLGFYFHRISAQSVYLPLSIYSSFQTLDFRLLDALGEFLRLFIIENVFLQYIQNVNLVVQTLLNSRILSVISMSGKLVLYQLEKHNEGAWVGSKLGGEICSLGFFKLCEVFNQKLHGYLIHKKHILEIFLKKCATLLNLIWCKHLNVILLMILETF